MPRAAHIMTLFDRRCVRGSCPARRARSRRSPRRQRRKPKAACGTRLRRWPRSRTSPDLPRVLLIGDSISIGYTLPVRELLRGKANVHRIPTNGGPTMRGLESIGQWLGDGHWDVIHFNWGLHDLKLIDGKHQVPIEDYEKNLAGLAKTLEATGAKLIWCSTTPVPEGAAGRQTADVVEYNAMARKIMAERTASRWMTCTASRRHGCRESSGSKTSTSRPRARACWPNTWRRASSGRWLRTENSPATAKPELVSVKKIWDQAPHNAFTDLDSFSRSLVLHVPRGRCARRRRRPRFACWCPTMAREMGIGGTDRRKRASTCAIRSCRSPPTEG